MTALLALVLAGCGGSSGSSSDKASVPSGFKTMSGQGYSFAYPSDWQTLDNIEGGQGAQRPTAACGARPPVPFGPCAPWPPSMLSRVCQSEG